MNNSAIIFAILILTGCTSGKFVGEKFSRDAVHYNNVASQANNRLMLTNVLRAKHRQPLYFSGLSELRGSLTYGGSLTLGGTVNGTTRTEGLVDGMASLVANGITRAGNVFSPSGAVNYSTSPSFDYQLLDTQEFYQGITGSIPTSTIANYLRQGWHSELLASMILEDVTFTARLVDGDNNVIKDTNGNNIERDLFIIENLAEYNGAQTLAESFGKFLRCYTITPTSRAAQRTVEIDFDDILKNASTESLEGIAAFSAEGWKVENKKITYERSRSDTIKLQRAEDAPKLDCNYSQFIRAEIKTANAMSKFQGNTKNSPIWKDNFSEIILNTAEDEYFENTENINNSETLIGDILLTKNPNMCSTSTTPKPKECEIDNPRLQIILSSHIRSTQGVIYFIGEYLRVVDDTTKKAYGVYDDGDGYACVFQVNKDDRFNRNLVSVDFRSADNGLIDTRYSIPYHSSNSSTPARTSRDKEPYCDPEDFGKGVGNDSVYNTLAFINDLVNLQKSAENRPSTTNVRSVQ